MKNKFIDAKVVHFFAGVLHKAATDDKELQVSQCAGGQSDGRCGEQIELIEDRYKELGVNVHK